VREEGDDSVPLRLVVVVVVLGLLLWGNGVVAAGGHNAYLGAPPALPARDRGAVRLADLSGRVHVSAIAALLIKASIPAAAALLPLRPLRSRNALCLLCGSLIPQGCQYSTGSMLLWLRFCLPGSA